MLWAFKGGRHVSEQGCIRGGRAGRPLTDSGAFLMEPEMLPHMPSDVCAAAGGSAVGRGCGGGGGCAAGSEVGPLRARLRWQRDRCFCAPAWRQP